VSSSGIAIGGTNSLLSPFGANVVDDKTLAKYRQLEQETVALRTQLEEQAGFLGQEKIGLRKRKPSFKSWNRR
jgi:hypothetical protein